MKLSESFCLICPDCIFLEVQKERKITMAFTLSWFMSGGNILGGGDCWYQELYFLHWQMGSNVCYYAITLKLGMKLNLNNTDDAAHSSVDIVKLPYDSWDYRQLSSSCFDDFCLYVCLFRFSFFSIFSDQMMI